MRTFLLAACPALLWCLAALQLALTLLLFRTRPRPLTLPMALISMGLCYDAFILSIGVFAKAGPVLRFFSRLRFVSHGALIPLLFVLCAAALGLGKKARTAVWCFTGVLMVLGASEGFCTVPEVREIAGICRYASSDATPAWAAAVSAGLSYGTVLPLMLCGIAVWIRQKTPLLFLAGFLMFAFSALGPATGNFDLIFLISMFGELGMTLCFWAYARRVQRTLPPRA